MVTSCQLSFPNLNLLWLVFFQYFILLKSVLFEIIIFVKICKLPILHTIFQVKSSFYIVNSRIYVPYLIIVYSISFY